MYLTGIKGIQGIKQKQDIGGRKILIHALRASSHRKERLMVKIHDLTLGTYLSGLVL
jgi:hypothetical protein